MKYVITQLKDSWNSLALAIKMSAIFATQSQATQMIAAYSNTTPNEYQQFLDFLGCWF